MAAQYKRIPRKFSFNLSNPDWNILAVPIVHHWASLLTIGHVNLRNLDILKIFLPDLAPYMHHTGTKPAIAQHYRLCETAKAGFIPA
jgi:hypothetical protein